MKKRTILRIFSFLIAIAIALFVFLIKYYQRSKTFQSEIKYTYSRSFEELNSSLNKINVSLEKAAYVSSADQISKIATEVYTESKIAKQAFSQLPTKAETIEKVNKFLSQVGNYSVFLAQKIISGGEIEAADRDNLEQLSDIAQDVSEGFSEIQTSLNNAEYHQTVLENAVNQALPETEFSEYLTEIDQSMADYPTLLYDGPYSDYISAKESELIKSSEPVDEETAKGVAAAALGINPEELSLDNYDSGSIPAYNFIYGEGAASVSINGGYLINFRKYNVGSEASLSYPQAITKAQEFMADNYSQNFIVNYYFTDNGVCVVNFALKQGAVICYTDLIKVGVDISNGDIVFFEARGYITNTKQRTIQTPEKSIEAAMETLNSSLNIKSNALALIPTEGGYEKLCYEFLCAGENGEEILIYINAETLAEEEIFIVLKTDGGTLVK